MTPTTLMDDYTPHQRLLLEFHIMLALYDLDMEAGEHSSGMRNYQRARVEDLLAEAGKPAL